MTIQKDFTLLSADKKTMLHAIEWLPEGEISAILQISHGVSEHIGRYDEFARFLTARGFAVVGNDHLGHGLSRAEGAAGQYFGPRGSWQTVVDDLYALRCRFGREHPGVPYFLLGHSMGSFLARSYLIRYPGTVEKAILMGTGQMPAAVIAGGKAVAAVEGRRVGWDKSSPLVEKLAFGSYNKPFAPNRTGFDWLSAESRNVDAYLSDPLCGGLATVGLFREMLDGLSFNADPKNLRKMNRNTPILFVSGAEDPVGDAGKGVRRALASFQKAGVLHTQLKLYPGLRHEILNEGCRAEIYEELSDWLSPEK